MADDARNGATPTPDVLEDDQPQPLEPGLPPEVASPLAPFAGVKPAAPAWFDAAIALEPERIHVPVLGARIEVLMWGDRGKPGLVLAHGNGAHADWWSFIAPFLAEDYRVAALSFAGMGGSDWRERYSFETFAAEIHAAAQAAGLYEDGRRPTYIGHSFGGAQVFYSAARYPERMEACILVDTGFGGPPTPEEIAELEKAAAAAGQPLGRWARGPGGRGQKPNRVYATLEEALTRFRFMPPQVPGNLYIADFIARRSLMRAPMADGSGEGWTWRFDPGIWDKLDRSGMTDPGRPRVERMAHIQGDRSEIIKRHELAQLNRRIIPIDMPVIVIPDSEHHIMVDQPLALVAALRSVLRLWRA